MSDKDEYRAEYAAMREQMVPSPELVEKVRVAVGGSGDGLTGGGESVRTADVRTPAHRPGSTAPLAKPTAAVGPAAGPHKSAHRPGRLQRRLGLVGGGVVAAGMAAVMFAGGLGTLADTTAGGQATWSAPVVVAPGQPASGGSVANGGNVDASTYSAVYKALAAAGAMYGWGGSYYGTFSTMEAPRAAPPAAGGPMKDMSGTVVDYTTSAAGTNVQVAGIDEGDFVKTDGTYLYVATGRHVYVVTAAGADSRIVADIDVTKLTTGDEIMTGPVADLMIDGKTLIVLTHGFTADTTNWTRDQGTYLGLQASTLKAAFYDISNPASPAYLNTVTQSGTYADSRLSDGVLYLVSRYYVPSADPDNPVTFVPLVGRDGVVSPVPAGDIYMCPWIQQPQYAVVTAIDVATRTVLGDQSLLGGSDTIYMSADSLYLAGYDWGQYDPATGQPRATGVNIPGTDQPYTDVTTDIVRIALNGGALAVAADTKVAGQLTDQFALDELDGNLRVVTTWTNNTNNNWQQNSALWVLGPDLKVLGSIPDLATNEAVQSVRFMGAVGYVVTFRQMDPLFAIDLSNPAKPEVKSALKIPGFSTYLQPFGDGLLLGIGVDVLTTDDNKGSWNGLKVSMFDVSDPYNVRELATAKIAGDDTEAARSHHAVYVDATQGLFGFPTTTYNSSTDGTTMNTQWNYLMYRWTGGKFGALTTLNLATDDKAKAQQMRGDTSTRGIALGENFYVLTDGFVNVYTTPDYAPATKVLLS